MKRLVLAVAVVFSFGAMCSGQLPGSDGATTDGEEGGEGGGAATDGKDTDAGDGKDKEVVVVPVPEGAPGENWCCEYVNEAGGTKLYAIVAGPAECNSKFASKEGRWVEGPQCTPCCCKSPNDKADASKGDTFELTTPGACSGVGECLAGDAEECKGQAPEEEEEPETDDPKPRNNNPHPGTGSKAKRKAQ